MVETHVIDLDGAIDGQAIRSSSIILLIVATLALLSDGFDIASIGFIAPNW